MSKRYAKSHPCPTALKTPFADEESAREALERILAEEGNVRLALPRRVYPCPCGSWHLTSTERGEAERERDLATSTARLSSASEAMRRIANA